MGRNLACIYKPLGWFPVVIVTLIAGWSYYAYVVVLCFDMVQNKLERILYIVFFHPFFLTFIISYWRAILTDPGKPPNHFYLTKEQQEKRSTSQDQIKYVDELGAKLPVSMRTTEGHIRFCVTCQMIKPDRTHCCSVCRSCVLKMDHHCPWVNNCVGFANYKFFILFLLYASLYSLYTASTCCKYFLSVWTVDKLQSNAGIHVLFLFFVAAMFAISLLCLFGFHMYLLLKNRTTLESFRAPRFATGTDKDAYHIGYYDNFKEVFGNNPCLWFLPVYTTLGNGWTFQRGGKELERVGLLDGDCSTDDNHVIDLSQQGHLIRGD